MSWSRARGTSSRRSGEGHLADEDEDEDEDADADAEEIGEDAAPEPFERNVDAAFAGARLDRYLADLNPEISRSAIQRHIELGAVMVDGAPPKRGASTVLREGSVVRYRPPPPVPTELLAEEIPLSILFEDPQLLVIDKPAGLVVHPGAGHASGTLVNALLHHVKDLGGVGGELRPGIVHRLDRDTTGAMVIAKDDAAQAALVAAWKSGRVEKEYLAVVHGLPRPTAATIETLFGRHPSDRKRFSSKVQSGKRALTHYRTLSSYPGAALLEVRIETGRTHQIRVHLSDRGNPVVGDPTYGGRRTTADPRTQAILRSFARPALHARRLGFAHPVSGETLRFEAPIPPDLSALIAALEEAKKERG
jgi:23S rRNA pseudouridine1911/1915/1917 synthase